VYAVPLEAGNLMDLETGACDPNVDQCSRPRSPCSRCSSVPGSAARKRVAVAKVGVRSAEETVDDTVSPRLPTRRNRVMSELPPPSRKREPFAKSAPAINVSTKAGISAGSADPSASSMTRASPVRPRSRSATRLPCPALFVGRSWRPVSDDARHRGCHRSRSIDDDHLMQTTGQLRQTCGRFCSR